MEQVEAMLNALTLDLGSVKKMKEAVRDRGICLRNGKEYGKDLPRKLRENRGLCVHINDAKTYPLAKKCLVAL